MTHPILTGFVLLQATPAGAPAAGATHESQSLDIWQLILDATPVVKVVMVLLVLMSVICWFIMGAKWVRVWQATRQSRRFLDLFWAQEGTSPWGAERLESIYGQIRQVSGSPLAKVFHAGYVELARLLSQGTTHIGEAALENVERSLNRTRVTEMTKLESSLPFLATTGSTGPFIGLFGTVWGIMHSFLNIGTEQSASLAVVAPGIAEALIATAIGLVAAIPAVAAYNYFLRKLRVLESEVETFSSDYLNIVKRHFL